MELARRQHGHVARWQLLDRGVRQGLIAGRLASGAWVAVHAGVYCIGPRRDEPVARAAAMVLACGHGAVLSHASAASLWGFLPRWSFPLEVTTKVKRTRPGILTHRCPSLQPRDSTRQRAIPSTSPARTALDLAPRLTARQRRRLVNDGRLNGYVRLFALEEVLQRNPYHPGTRLLRPFVENPHNPTRSPFEDDFLAYPEIQPPHPAHQRRRQRPRGRRLLSGGQPTPTTSTTATAPSASPNSASPPRPTTKPHACRGSSTGASPSAAAPHPCAAGAGLLRCA